MARPRKYFTDAERRDAIYQGNKERRAKKKAELAAQKARPSGPCPHTSFTIHAEEVPGPTLEQRRTCLACGDIAVISSRKPGLTCNPNPTPLQTIPPTQPKPPPMTGAERHRRWRERHSKV